MTLFKPITKLLAVGAAVAGFYGTAKEAEAQSANPILGSVYSFGFNFCPRGWAKADGQLLPINQNQSLFSLFGTFYGGDGRTTFALPDLRSRVPINYGTGPGLSTYQIGNRGGAEVVTLLVSQMPSHNHIVNVTNVPGDKLGPRNDFMADPPPILGEEVYGYHDGPANGQMDPGVISNTGGSLWHENRPPYLAVTYCVAMIGVFPSRN